MKFWLKSIVGRKYVIWQILEISYVNIKYLQKVHGLSISQESFERYQNQYKQ